MISLLSRSSLLFSGSLLVVLTLPAFDRMSMTHGHAALNLIYAKEMLNHNVCSLRVLVDCFHWLTRHRSHWSLCWKSLSKSQCHWLTPHLDRSWHNMHSSTSCQRWSPHCLCLKTISRCNSYCQVWMQDTLPRLALCYSRRCLKQFPSVRLSPWSWWSKHRSLYASGALAVVAFASMLKATLAL